MNPKTKYDHSLKGRFRYGKAKAKKRGIEWGLTLDEYGELVGAGICSYCIGPLGLYGSGLDRKDNRKGYTKENSTSCCGGCNRFKSDQLTSKEMRMIRTLLRIFRDEI